MGAVWSRGGGVEVDGANDKEHKNTGRQFVTC